MTPELLYRVTDVLSGNPVAEVDTFRAARRLIMKQQPGRLYRITHMQQMLKQWIFSSEEIPDDET